MKLNDKKDGDNGYIVLYNGKQYDVYAKTSFDAQQVTASKLKVKQNKQIIVSL